jgi:adenine C2-methylase RlmN of 23S rRNA A2503 and tRNA A37
MMNIAYNDRRLMPRTPGYDLEKFTITSGLYKGRKVGNVLNDAYLLLGGATPASIGLTSCAQLVDVITQINANYAFVDFNTFTDNGYLVPNRTLGQPDPPTTPTVPYSP